MLTCQVGRIYMKVPLPVYVPCVTPACQLMLAVCACVQNGVIYTHAQGGGWVLHVYIWLFEHIQVCVRVFMSTVPACLCVFVFVFYLCICCISKHFDNTFSRDRVCQKDDKRKSELDPTRIQQYVWWFFFVLFCFGFWPPKRSEHSCLELGCNRNRKYGDKTSFSLDGIWQEKEKKRFPIIVQDNCLVCIKYLIQVFLLFQTAAWGPQIVGEKSSLFCSEHLTAAKITVFLHFHLTLHVMALLFSYFLSGSPQLFLYVHIWLAWVCKVMKVIPVMFW